MSNQEEIVVSRRNLFLNSEDRSEDVNSDFAYNGQRITIPLQNLNIIANDNQFIRLKLESFTAPNSFDNHAALDQNIFTYFGANLLPKQNDADPLPDNQLVNHYLIMPRYTTFQDIMTDATEAIARNFQTAGFTTTDWDYTFNGVWGQGTALYPATKRDGTTPPSAFNAGVSPGLVSPPQTYDEIGYYSQGGYNGLVGQFTLVQNKTLWWGAAGSGQNEPTLTAGSLVDNTNNLTAIQVTSYQDSDVYLQVGGRKGYLPQSQFPNPAGTTAQQGNTWSSGGVYWKPEATTNGSQNQLFIMSYATLLMAAVQQHEQLLKYRLEQFLKHS